MSKFLEIVTMNLKLILVQESMRVKLTAIQAANILKQDHDLVIKEERLDWQSPDQSYAFIYDGTDTRPADPRPIVWPVTVVSSGLKPSSDVGMPY